MEDLNEKEFRQRIQQQYKPESGKHLNNSDTIFSYFFFKKI